MFLLKIGRRNHLHKEYWVCTSSATHLYPTLIDKLLSANSSGESCLVSTVTSIGILPTPASWPLPSPIDRPLHSSLDRPLPLLELGDDTLLLSLDIPFSVLDDGKNNGCTGQISHVHKSLFSNSSKWSKMDKCFYPPLFIINRTAIKFSCPNNEKMKHHAEGEATQINNGCANPSDRTLDNWHPFTYFHHFWNS